MSSTDFYSLLAHLVLLIHFVFVAFVVVGLLLTWLGYFLRWKFVRNFYFRSAHLLAMAVVLLEALFGVVCPLTTWEIQLRKLSGQIVYEDKTFMQYWLHKIMFFQLEQATFTIIYSCFFTALILSFVFVFPELPWRKENPLPGQPETENDPRDR